MDKERLCTYAQIIIEKGLVVKPGDGVKIKANIEAKEAVLAMTEAAYKAGAKDVVVDWSYQPLSKLRYDNQDLETLKEVDHYLVDRYRHHLEKKYKLLALTGDDPYGLSACNPEKVSETMKAHMEAMADISKMQMANYVSWCVAGAATESWAKCVFPELPVAEAVEKLWDLIFFTVRMDEADPLAAWDEHIRTLNKRAQKINDYQFTELHYRSQKGTDLHLGLPKGYRFIGANEKNQQGEDFVANMPTEEIFSMPDRNRVDGIVYSTKPLNSHGNIIDEFSLTFKGGAVVDFTAQKGYDTLKHLLATDEGARHLGEVALVPYHSPISLSNTLFYNTLYDENASCHLALGRAYPTTIEGGLEMSEEELKTAGCNDSLIHCDFMMGDETTEIDGIMANGERIAIFRNGDFVI